MAVLSGKPEKLLVGEVVIDQATPSSSSTSVSHITQAVEGIQKVVLGRVSASIILVFNGTRSMRREPFVDFRFPPVSQVVSGLEGARRRPRCSREPLRTHGCCNLLRPEPDSRPAAPSVRGKCGTLP